MSYHSTQKAVILQRLSKRKDANTYLLIAKVLGTCVHVNGRSNQSQAQNFQKKCKRLLMPICWHKWQTTKSK